MLSTPTCLKLNHDNLHSSFACFGFNCNLRHYMVVGGVMFGAGWGLAGLCPGPAIVSMVGRCRFTPSSPQADPRLTPG